MREAYSKHVGKSAVVVLPTEGSGGVHIHVCTACAAFGDLFYLNLIQVLDSEHTQRGVTVARFLLPALSLSLPQHTLPTPPPSDCVSLSAGH